MLTSFAHWSIKIFLHLLFSSVVYSASSPSPCVEISGGNFAPLGFNTSFRCSFAIKCGRESSILWLKVVDDKPMVEFLDIDDKFLTYYFLVFPPWPERTYCH